MSFKELHPFQTFIDRLPSLSLDGLVTTKRGGDEYINKVSEENAQMKTTPRGGSYGRKTKPKNPFQLDSIEINNFKSIISSTLEVENSSFIGGYNSSGKSAHTQLVLLLNQWLLGESISLDGAIPINGPFISLGDEAIDLIHRYVPTSEESITDAEMFGNWKLLAPHLIIKPITAVFNFSIMDGEEIGKRSFFFEMSPHETSKSSFRIDEISVRDTILSKARLDQLDRDLQKRQNAGIVNIFGTDNIFKFSEKVTYTKKYVSKSVYFRGNLEAVDNVFSKSVINAFALKTAIGRSCIPGDGYSSNPYRDLDSISFFTEEVSVDNKTFSINSVHPYNVSISSNLNYSLGQRQPEYLIDTRLAIKSGILFKVYSLIEQLIKTNIFSPRLQSNLENSFSDSAEVSEDSSFQLDAIKFIKKITDEINEAIEISVKPYEDNKRFNFDTTKYKDLMNSYKKKIETTLNLLEEHDVNGIEDNLILFCILLEPSGKTFSRLDAVYGYKDKYIAESEWIMRLGDNPGEDNIFANPKLFVELLKNADLSYQGDNITYSPQIQQKPFSDNIYKNLSNFITEYTLYLFSDTLRLSARIEDRLRSRIEFAINRIDLPPSSPLDDEGFNETLTNQARFIFHALDSHSETIKLGIDRSKSPEDIGSFVQTKIDEKAADIVKSLFGEENLNVIALLRLMFLIPSTNQELSFYNVTYTLLSAINEDSNTPSRKLSSSVYEIPENNKDTIQAYQSKPIDYALMSSFVMPQNLTPTPLLKNTDPIFDFRFLNSARGYTNTSEFHGGKDVTPLGINGQYTASFLFLNSNSRYNGPDISKNSRNNIINTLFETDGDSNLELNHCLKESKIGQTLLEHINDWIKYIFDVDEKIAVSESSYGKYVLYLGGDLLNNVGSGISQALPIIINIIIGEKKSIFLEEVEQNLHASAQAKIADMIMFFSLYDRKFIVETHSEHILNRMRLRKIQLDKNISSKNLFNLYFVSSTKETGSVAEKIEVNSKGQFEESKLNSGFFDQSQLDTLKILKEIQDL